MSYSFKCGTCGFEHVSPYYFETSTLCRLCFQNPLSPALVSGSQADEPTSLAPEQFSARGNSRSLWQRWRLWAPLAVALAGPMPGHEGFDGYRPVVLFLLETDSGGLGVGVLVLLIYLLIVYLIVIVPWAAYWAVRRARNHLRRSG